MNVKELRIGNYIQGMYDSEEELFCRCTVVCLDSFDIAEYPINVVSEQNSEYFYEFKPIPLTEELLLKFGFEIEFKWSDEILYKKCKYGIAYAVKKDEWIFVLGNTSIKLKYVHQLQNLYFALTGEELTFIK